MELVELELDTLLTLLDELDVALLAELAELLVELLVEEDELPPPLPPQALSDSASDKQHRMKRSWYGNMRFLFQCQNLSRSS